LGAIVRVVVVNVRAVRRDRRGAVRRKDMCWVLWIRSLRFELLWTDVVLAMSAIEYLEGRLLPGGL
jgi:hypothetical protein